MAPKLKLRIEAPEGKPIELGLTAGIVLGRNPKAGVCLPFPTVSFNHAAILETEKGWFIKDLGSTNGTYLNGKKLSRPALLRPGDRIRIGPCDLVVLRSPKPEKVEPTEGEESEGKKAPRKVLYLIPAASLLVTLLVVLFAFVLPGKKEPAKPEVARKVRPEKAKPKAKKPSKTGREEPQLLEEFKNSIEGPLLSWCLPCHDGRDGGRFVLFSGLPERLRCALNFRSVRCFLRKDRLEESRLIQKATNLVPHGGGPALPEEQAKQILEKLRSIGNALSAEKEAAPRPVFALQFFEIDPEKEILIRRAYLDILERPPTEEELREKKTQTLSAIAQSLLESSEGQKLWKGKEKALLSLWGKLAEGRQRLSDLYQWKLKARPKRKKSIHKCATSLLVDLLGKIPSEQEVSLLKDAISELQGNLLPLACFLLGEVKVPKRKDKWIRRVFVRFLLKVPEEREVKRLGELIQSDSEARAFLLALASSPQYKSY